MISIILLIILFVGLSIWLMYIGITDKNVTKKQICINLGLWVLGFYIAFSICSLIKYINI